MPARLKKWLAANPNLDEHVDFFGLFVAAATILIFAWSFYVFIIQIEFISNLYYGSDKTLPQLLGESPWKLLMLCCPPAVFWLLGRRRRCQNRREYLLCLGGMCAILLLLVLSICADIHYITTEWGYLNRATLYYH